MNILITGVGPHNKGAELMLLAILDQLRRRKPEARAAISPIGSPYSWRAELGLLQLFDRHQSGRMGWLRERLFHEGYRARFGMVTPNEIDVVLDASGYLLGDVWKCEWVEAVAKQIARYKEMGAKIILLPQAFGPFGKERIRSAARIALMNSDMVFARDNESLVHCRELVENHVELHQAPDFTNLVSGHKPEDWVVDEKQVAVIPNEKMLTHSDRNVARRYLPAVCEAIEYVSSAGYHPFILVHEHQDMELASEISSSTASHCPVIAYDDPLAVKGIVRCCAFVISSRYHGLVNSLSQGVPAIAIGWSHKYCTLLRDYDFPDGVWGPGGREWSDHTPVDILLNESARREVASTLKIRSRAIEERVGNMWDKVEGCIDSIKM